MKQGSRYKDIKSSEQYWVVAQRRGLFSIFVLHQKLKYRDNYNPITKMSKEDKNPYNDKECNANFFSNYNRHSDMTGGFIRKDSLRKIAKQIGYSYNTLRMKLPVMESLGLVIRCKTGWVMVSIIKVAKTLGIDLGRLRIKGKTKQEIKDKVARSVIKNVSKYQDRSSDRNNGSSLGTLLSCARLSKLTGHKSPSTGIKMR